MQFLDFLISMSQFEWEYANLYKKVLISTDNRRELRATIVNAPSLYCEHSFPSLVLKLLPASFEKLHLAGCL